MKEKYERMALYHILDNLNKGKKTITTREMASLTDEEGSFFEKSKAPELMRRLEENKIVCKSGEETYSVIVDIATLREIVLRFGKPSEGRRVDAKAPTPLDDVLKSEWVAVDKDKEREERRDFFRGIGLEGLEDLSDDDADETDDEEDDEDDDSEESETDVEARTAKRRAYLEARRREILRRMQADIEDDDDDDDGDEAEVEPLDDPEDKRRDDADEKMPFEAFVMTQEMGSGVPVIKSDGAFFFVPAGLVIGQRVVRFKIVVREDYVFLSDDGFAIHTLKDRAPIDGEGMDAEIDAILNRYDVEREGDELRIEIGSPENAVTCMIQLFAAMERIVALDADYVSTRAEYDRQNLQIWGIVRGLLETDPEMGHAELVMHLRERYESVKDGDDMDEVILYARALSEFENVSDDGYLQCRELLLDETPSSNADAKEESVDPLCVKALALVVQTGRASISLVQRKCGIGYNHAGKIMDWMERMGYISPFDPSEGRKVLMTEKEFIRKYGPLD